MSSLDVALRGGPPWGFRIGHDESERPIIAKVLPGGRAAAEGVHEGDVIQAVNNEPIREAKSAHTKVHSTTPGLTLFLKLVRYAPDSTPSLVHNSIIDTPLVTRKEFPKPAANATNENGAVRNNNYSPHLPRSLRLDVQSSERGLRTQDKRRFFENLCNSPKLMRDPLLARKIALGLADANSAPSESGTYVSGYDSVFGDLCDGSRLSSVASVRSDGPSSVNSVNGDEDNTQCETLLLPEPDIERALHQQHKPLGRQPDQPPPITQDPLSCLYLPPLSPLPSGTFGSALPSLSPAKMEPAGPSTPSSYLVHAPHSYPAPQVLDHAPPAVPPHQNGSNGWTVRTEVANVQPAHCEIEVPGRRSVAALREHIAEKLDVHGPDQKPRPKTPVKSWIKVHEPGTFEPPAAAASAASQGFGRVLDGPLPASANFYQGVPPPSYNYVHPKKVTPPKSSDDDSATPSSASELFTADSRLLKNNSNGYPQANGYPPLPQQQRIPQDSPAVEARARSCVTPCRMERPSIERVSIERATLQTSDLESAELGRRHSPSFSSASSEHLGTIRRKPKESEVDLPVKMDSGVSSTMDIHVPMLTPGDSPGYASYSTATHDSPADSGYDASPESRKDSLITVRESPPPPFSSHITEAFTSLPPSVLPSKDEKKDELPSKARVEEPVQEERPSSTTPGPNYKRDDSEMGAWYRNMYKRLHKIEGGDASILKYYLNDDSSVPGSRPHTPSTRRGASPPIAYRAPSPATSTQFDVDARPRARSVGREYHGPSAALPPPSPTKKHGERLSEDGAAARGTTPVGYELAEEIERLKRITSDEMATSIRAEKLGEELDRERSRRHGYIPSAAPSLQNNTDRFNGLLNAYGGDERNMSPARSVSSGTGVKMAIALYRFSPQSERELALNKGDIIRLRREIDGNWMEGERNGRVGIFPASYVEVEEPSERKERLRAVYPFTARNANEMSLKLGDVVTFRRPIDEYWTEGLNHIGEIGIFPTCYVRPIEEVMDAPLPAVIPERPKTPKLPGSGVSFGGVSYNDGFSSFDRPVERLDRRSHESALPPSQSSYDNSQRSPQSLTRTSAPPASHYHNIPDTSRFDDLVRDPSINLPFPLPERVPSEGRELKSRAAIEADAVRLDETLNELLATLPGSPIPVTKTENKPNGFHHPPSTAQPAAPASQQPHLNGGPGYAPTSSTNDKVAAWQHRHSTSGYTGAASMIPKGAQAFRVLYPYAPVNDDELELKVDDIVFVVEKCDDGWFIGTLLRTGQFGTFPGNFVESH